MNNIFKLQGTKINQLINYQFEFIKEKRMRDLALKFSNLTKNIQF